MNVEITVICYYCRCDNWIYELSEKNQKILKLMHLRKQLLQQS
ncbi:hypothetical protein Q5M85_21215 [Paraclostridium bifermentans]|nr:hypothetical protein [Paraclostridium bifermentans]